MKLLKKIFIYFLGLIVSGCYFGGSDLSQESKLCYKLIKQSGKRIGQKFNLVPSVVGAGGVDGLELMTLYFNKYGDPLTQEDARKLIILCAEEFLKDINSDEKLRPYLMDFPFSEKNIEVAVLSYDYKGRLNYEPYIGVVTVSEGNIRYVTYVPDKLNKNYQFTETYEEALEKLKQEEQKHTEASS